VTFFLNGEQLEGDPDKQNPTHDPGAGHLQENSSDSREDYPKDNRQTATDYDSSPAPSGFQSVCRHPNHDGIVTAQDQIHEHDSKH
jgi:hypothetical protein